MYHDHPILKDHLKAQKWPRYRRNIGPRRKWTDQEVLDIRLDATQNLLSRKRLCEKYNIRPAQLSYVLYHYKIKDELRASAHEMVTKLSPPPSPSKPSLFSRWMKWAGF